MYRYPPPCLDELFPRLGEEGPCPGTVVVSKIYLPTKEGPPPGSPLQGGVVTREFAPCRRGGGLGSTSRPSVSTGAFAQCRVQSHRHRTICTAAWIWCAAQGGWRAAPHASSRATHPPAGGHCIHAGVTLGSPGRRTLRDPQGLCCSSHGACQEASSLTPLRLADPLANAGSSRASTAIFGTGR